MGSAGKQIRQSIPGYEDSRHAEGQSHFTPKGSFSSIKSLPTQNRRRKGYHGLPLLSNIPDIYFDEEFHLENPRTFDVFGERSEVVPPASINETSNENAPAPSKALATNAILQEKLSWYMDTVEVHLINSVSLASNTFLLALKSMRDLHSEAAESVEDIQTLRKVLAFVDDDVATEGLELLQKWQKYYNLHRMNDAVQQLKRIVYGVAYCESLVDEEEVEKALAAIHAVESLMASERDELWAN